MNRMYFPMRIALFLMVWVSVLELNADTVTFDHNVPTWATMGVQDDANLSETAVIEVATDLFINLTITLNSQNVGVDNQGELNVDARNTWRNSDDSFKFTLSITDNSISQNITAISLNTIVIGSLNVAGDQVTVSEDGSANAEDLDNSYNAGISEADLYTTGSLTEQLSLATISTWDIIINNTGSNDLGGIASLSFDYTLANATPTGAIVIID
ncbi:MAG: hypothetical protein HQL32_09990 [Planctomycetes bacterium]|nr:hypothetical protein [Planctomycetota bacterium]